MPEPKRHEWPVPRLPVGTMGVYTGYEHVVNQRPLSIGARGSAQAYAEVLPGDVCIVTGGDTYTSGEDLPTWRSLRTGEEFVEFSPCFTPVQEDT